MQYIVVQTGTFADGKGTGSYQIAKLCSETGAYHIIGFNNQEITRREYAIMVHNWARTMQSALDVCHQLLHGIDYIAQEELTL